MALDEMGERTSPAERLIYYHQFEDQFSNAIDFEQYIDVRAPVNKS